MASLADIHAALAGCMNGLGNLTADPFPPQGSRPPRAHVALSGWVPIAMGRKGRKTYTFRVFVFTAESVRPQDGYQALMRYADSSGDLSVEVAVWDGNDAAAGTFTGGGVVCDDTSAYVSEFEVLGAELVDAFQMYGGVFNVVVETKGS